MRIAIAGATGLIGSQLTALARKEGREPEFRDRR